MRHKLRYPANTTPCDQIIPRCYCETDRRLLTDHDILKARSLKHQVTTASKRQQAGDGLFTFDEDVHVEALRTEGVYMAKLHALLLALAITVKAKQSYASDKETFGSDPLKFVAAPWDIWRSYYFRGVESIAAIPEASRMAWVEGVDLAEGAVWVSTFKDGGDTIGEVIRQTTDRRGSSKCKVR